MEVRMQTVLRFIDRASEWTGKCASFLAVVLILAIGYDVALRYLFARPTFWAFEVIYMVYGAYAALGAAYCHYRKGHVRMDLIYSRLSPRGQATVDMICYLFLFFPLFFVLVYTCGGHAIWALSYGERSSVSIWRPLLAPYKLLIAFGFLLFLFQGIAEFIRSLYIVFKGGPHES